jgi:anti-sigma B factor antagonist
MSDAAVTLIEHPPEAVVVRVQVDRLDESSLKVLRSDTSAAAAESPHLPVILDLAKVAFMPSLSLGAMVQLAKEFQIRKQRLILAGLQPFVRETMSITRLDRLFEIHEDLPAAVKAARGGL